MAPKSSFFCPRNGFPRSPGVKNQHLKVSTEVSMLDAANALRGYARGGANVDPTSQEQKRAYIALRDTHSRCTATQFVKYLESIKTKVSQGAKTKQVFWAVPKVNFPEGLPDFIQAATKSDEECEGFLLDPAYFYLVDQCISRRDLKTNVHPVEKYLATSIEGKLQGAIPPSAGSRRPCLAVAMRAARIELSSDDAATSAEAEPATAAACSTSAESEPATAAAPSRLHIAATPGR